jgi:hypothetical protein
MRILPGVGACGMMLLSALPSLSRGEQPFYVGARNPTGDLCVTDMGYLLVAVGGEGKLHDNWSLPPQYLGENVGISLQREKGVRFGGFSVAYDASTLQVVLGNDGDKLVLSAWKATRDDPAKGTLLQAAGGKYAGWYMAVHDRDETGTDAEGNLYKYRRVVLVEKPGDSAYWTIGQVSP